MSTSDGSRIVRELALAVQTEVDGYTFYVNLSKSLSDDKAKNLFAHLAKDELEHMKAIRTIAASLSEGKGWLGYDDALTASADHGLPVFPDENELTKRFGGEGTDISALDMAMEIEEASVAQYEKLLGEAGGDAGSDEERVLLEKLIDMEKGHCTLLRWEREALVKDGFWCDHMEYSVEKEVG